MKQLQNMSVCGSCCKSFFIKFFTGDILLERKTECNLFWRRIINRKSPDFALVVLVNLAKSKIKTVYVGISR